MIRKMNILVVDNEPDALETINNILTNTGENYNLFFAINGIKALRIIEKEQVDLIITDWVMPEMTGIELVEELQKKEDFKIIPVIVCSGVKIEIEDLRKAHECGAIDFVSKPIDSHQLITRIKSILRLTHSLKKVAEEKQLRLELEKQHLETTIKLQNEDLNSKALSISRFNSLLSGLNKELKKLAKDVNDTASEINISGMMLTIDKNINDDNWNDFKISFEKHYPDFFKKLHEINPTITNKELQLAAFLKINSNTKSIANITRQSLRSIEMARFRLRKKLNIPKEETFESFFSQFV